MQQHILTTDTRLPLAEFPMPAYELISLPEYFLASIQFSSGCPYTCEFCDIPALYGRVAQLKTPEQIIAELDRLREGGAESVYFVDDNFAVQSYLFLIFSILMLWDHSRPFSYKALVEHFNRFRHKKMKSAPVVEDDQTSADARA